MHERNCISKHPVYIHYVVPPGSNSGSGSNSRADERLVSARSHVYPVPAPDRTAIREPRGAHHAGRRIAAPQRDSSERLALRIIERLLDVHRFDPLFHVVRMAAFDRSAGRRRQPRQVRGVMHGVASSSRGIELHHLSFVPIAHGDGLRSTEHRTVGVSLHSWAQRALGRRDSHDAYGIWPAARTRAPCIDAKRTGARSCSRSR